MMTSSIPGHCYYIFDTQLSFRLASLMHAKLEWESRYFQHFCVRFVIPNNRLFRAFFINQLIFLLEWIQNVDVNHLDEVRCIGKCNWLCRCLRISSVPSSTNPNVILSHSQICLIFEIGMDSSCVLFCHHRHCCCCCYFVCLVKSDRTYSALFNNCHHFEF